MFTHTCSISSRAGRLSNPFPVMYACMILFLPTDLFHLTPFIVWKSCLHASSHACWTWITRLLKSEMKSWSIQLKKKIKTNLVFFLLPSTCFIYVPETLYSSNWNHLRGPFAQRANWCLRGCRITAAILSWSNVADMITSLWMRSTGRGGAVGVRNVLYPLIVAFHGVSVLARTEGGRGEIAEDVN